MTKPYVPRNLVTLNQGSPAFDGFGRLRVSNPQTIFDSKMQYSKNALFWDEATVSGSGFTSTFLADEAAVLRAQIEVAARGNQAIEDGRGIQLVFGQLFAVLRGYRP